MLNENGVVIDDGTVARLGREHFVVTTTSGGAAHRRLARGVARSASGRLRGLRLAGDDAVGDCRHRRPRARQLLARPHRHRLRLALDAAHEPARGKIRRRARAPLSSQLLGRARLRDQRRRRFGAAPERTPEGRHGFRRDATRRRDRAALRLEKGYLHVGVDTDGTTAPADVGWGAIAAAQVRTSSASARSHGRTTSAPTGCSSSA